tara:strand:- start:294 stop:578 length:285 start_codon:yes stop_codon:yes gene_type:complete
VNVINQIETQEEISVDVKLTKDWSLIVYNDDHNTFDHVIERLVNVCGHTVPQAEQCAVLIHYKGKCEVKTGAYEKLEPMCTSLLEADITAEIEP